MYEVKESDWKILRKKVPTWQENYMGKLIAEYVELLNSDADASVKFWELEKRIRSNKKDTGVIIDMRRSRMVENLISLYNEGAITLDDLSYFSEELQQTIKKILRLSE